MAFREKMAWLSLAAMLAAFGPYFVATVRFGPLPWRMGSHEVGLLVGSVVLLTLIMIVGAIALAVTSVRDAGRPTDERDRTIARRAVAIAYAVLIPALFGALATLLLGWGVAGVVNAVLAAIVLAELVRLSIEIVGYRRGY